MNADELVGLVEKGDLHGAMLLVLRAWLAKYHPEVNDLVLLGEIAQGRQPGIRIPITSVSSPLLVSSPPSPRG